MQDENSDFIRSDELGEFYIAKGVGPHSLPWPEGEEYDQQLLREGDNRNVIDEFRYLTVDAIRARLAQKRLPLEIAIENWRHDLNIGSLVRTSNAFNLNAVHIVGQKHWNQHGALMTDKYIDIKHHSSVSVFSDYAKSQSLPVIGIENGVQASPLTEFNFPRPCILFFGNEGKGLTTEALAVCNTLVEIPQFGSVRSMNASAAGAIAIFEWVRQHAQ